MTQLAQYWVVHDELELVLLVSNKVCPHLKISDQLAPGYWSKIIWRGYGCGRSSEQAEAILESVAKLKRIFNGNLSITN
jgi:hypothetical protein